MLGNDNTRALRKIIGLPILSLLLAAATCAAPDAQPTAERPPPEMPDASDAADASDASETPNEPIAGDPVLGVGFGEPNDQKLFDVAWHSATSSIVTTMGFISSIVLPGFNDGKPYMSGSMSTPAAVQNILVVMHDPASGKAVGATQIHNGSEITRTVIDVDAQGDIVVAGGFNGTLEFPVIGAFPTINSYDAYIAKLDSMGTPLWARTFGTNGEQYVTDVATDGSRNIIVVGFAAGGPIDFGDGVSLPSVTSKDIFVAKYDPDGKLVWAKRVGEAGATDVDGTSNWRNPTATVAASAVDDSIVVAGTYRGTLNFPPITVMPVSGEDGFVVKLDENGNGLWHLGFGGANSKQRVRSVALGPSDEVVFVGAVQGKVDILGASLNSFKGSHDLLVAKVDADGKAQWSRIYGSLGQQIATKVLVDDKGSLFVGGSFTGSLDFFHDGSLTNTTKDVPYTPTDIFVSKFNGNGTPLWARAFGDANPATLVGIQTIEGAAFSKNAKAEPLVTFGGINSGSLDFDGTLAPLQSIGAEDAFMMSITY